MAHRESNRGIQVIDGGVISRRERALHVALCCWAAISPLPYNISVLPAHYSIAPLSHASRPRAAERGSTIYILVIAQR